MKYNYKDAISFIYMCLMLQVGFTALHWASKTGNFEVVKLLIENGAQIDVPAKVWKLVLCNTTCHVIHD